MSFELALFSENAHSVGMRIFISGLVILALVSGVCGQTPPPVPSQSRHFDFWIGEWQVIQPNGKIAGRSTIEAILNGRVIKESYKGTGGYSGYSFNSYNTSAKRWEQYWVDNSGLVLHMKGGLNEKGQMVLAGDRMDAKGEAVRDRITWSDHGDGTVRQLWEMSSDGGETWSTAFDGHYQPKQAAEPQ